MSKGSGYKIYAIKDGIIKTAGKDCWDQIVDAADDDIKDELTKNIRFSEKYDDKVFQNLLVTIKNVKGKDFMLQTAIYEAEKELSGAFGLVVKFLSVEKVIKKMHSMWHRNWDTGKIELIDRAEGYYKVRISDFATNDTHMLHLTAYINRVIEIVTRKKYDSSCLRIDKTTMDFTFREAKNS